MDWNKIKTIFIIAFLILDLFLLSQLMTKTRQFEEKKDPTTEENIKSDGIKYDGIPKDIVSDHYMSANTKIFTKEELAKIEDKIEDSEELAAIHVTLKTPIVVNEKQDFFELNDFVHSHVLYGEDYDFWSYDKEENTITYYQKYDDKLLFMNRSAHLVFHVNENGEAISYEQTMLDAFDPISEQEELYPAMRALEALYLKGYLKPGSEVVKTKIGYHTLVNMEAIATQVLTPTWHFLVKNKDNTTEDLLVNAFEGQIIQAQQQANEKTKME
ncbi:two-component system regulatory protein YycI [Lederbergia panacisoli]|uniref:two-component system regulatory protein YycI n=1 Tax=Lederbergia panacisoli TaxID=1255251 RepID=UPI00214ABF2F|nr:two-component system regulatory protein YycI [Lederbergia panacisoli]MCR2822732.1 two-component system regulatory protein YycI [Lederbergia panacisoli]